MKLKVFFTHEQRSIAFNIMYNFLKIVKTVEMISIFLMVTNLSTFQMIIALLVEWTDNSKSDIVSLN